MNCIEMTYQTIFTILTVLCCSVYTASIEDTGKYNSDNQRKWNEAFRTCNEKKERLPNVEFYRWNLQLSDPIHPNQNECFWTGATYEHNTNYSNGTFPTVSCGTMTKQDNRYVFVWSSCQAYVQFLCESDANTVSDYRPPQDQQYRSWTDASKVCHDQGLFLASETNQAFQGKLSTAPWWVNATRLLNLSPVIAKNGDIPTCFCEGTFMDLQCPVDVKTFCLPYSSLNISTTWSFQTSVQSPDTYSTKLIATVSSESGESLHEESYVTASTSTPFSSVNPTIMVHTENGTLVGGLTGAAVALVLGFTIIMIVIIKCIRRKRKANDDVKPKTQVNARSTKDVPSQQRASYDTILEDDCKDKDTKTGSPQMQIVLQGFVMHEHPHNVKDISMKNKDDNTFVCDIDRPLYSMVQKGHKKKSNIEAIKTCDDSDNKYVRIDFEERPVECEGSEHVYDKAKIHDLGLCGGNDENLYNKADFTRKVFDKIGSNTYGIGNFSRIEGSCYDTTSRIDGSIDQTYEHI